MATYENAEAKQILARAAGKLVPHAQAKHAESAELLKALVALNGFGGFKITVNGNEIEVQVGSRLAGVRYGVAEGRFFITGRSGHQFPVSLRFDPVLNRFEGETDDTYRNPQPGQPTSPREALAVLVDAICAALAS
jgi:hypothetical protein